MIGSLGKWPRSSRRKKPLELPMGRTWTLLSLTNHHTPRWGALLGLRTGMPWADPEDPEWLAYVQVETSDSYELSARTGEDASWTLDELVDDDALVEVANVYLEKARDRQRDNPSRCQLPPPQFQWEVSADTQQPRRRPILGTWPPF